MRYSPAKEFAVRIVIGIALLVGAPLLAWFSSIATLDLRKDGARGASAELSRELFGIVPISREAVADVTGVSMVRSRAPGSDSDTPDRLVFATRSGPVDLGYDQQRFARDYAAIRGFLDDGSQPRLTLTSADRWDEKLRFASAQFIAVVLLFGGVGLIRGALSRRRLAASG